MFRYAEALSEWKTDQKFQGSEEARGGAKSRARRSKVIKTWANRVNDFRAKMPDFDDMVGSADVVVSNEVRDSIFESDVGPQILYHLAENPDIAKKLQGVSVTSALRMIGKLEAKFEATPTSTPESLL